ncbi:MAG TPA: hypothetical protein PLE74_07240 [Candidatus Cloacimonadota bacterium]|nr:hypothetical protein [Candidatus Cloacimonadota bacterium]
MNRKLLLLLVLSIGLLTSLQAISSNADYGFKMLNIPVGVGISAQSGTGSFSNMDASAFLENPVALVLRSERLISFTQNSYLMDTNQNSIFYSYANNKRHFGIGLRNIDYDTIEKRDDTGQIVGFFHPLDLNLMVNTSYRILPDHYAGINAGLLYEKIDAASSYGMTFDFGYMFLPPIQDTKLYADIRNIGFTSKMDEESIKLPERFEWGISHDFTNIYNQPMKATLEFKSISEVGSSWRGNVGVQVAYQDIFSFRFGSNLNYLLSDFINIDYHDAPTWSIGAGFYLTPFLVDYAYTPYRLVSSDMDSVHRVGVTYRF